MAFDINTARPVKKDGFDISTSHPVSGEPSLNQTFSTPDQLTGWRHPER
jgi:hypothetical protein